MIRLEDIHLKIGTQLLLENESLEIHNGYIHVIMGESGSGKTTLLHEISLLSNYSKCKYLWNDKRIDVLDDKEKSHIRRNNIGYILQDLELISENLTLRDNLACMFLLTGKQYDEEIVMEYMHKLNLYTSLEENISVMSRGERQRFAMVLALIKDSELIICDEPTSALDMENSRELMRYLKIIAREYHKMIVIATHDEIVAEYADMLYRIKDKHLAVEGCVTIECMPKNAGKHKGIDKLFYRIYKKAHRKPLKMVMNSAYVLMIAVLCLSPILLEQLLDRQQELFKLYADNEIIISNTEERLPYSSYNAICDDFSDSSISMLKEIDNVKDVRYYWEMDGVLNTDDRSVPIKIIPRNNTDIITVSSSLSKVINEKSKLNAYLDYSGNSYNLIVSLDEYVVKDYHARKGIDKEIIYIPYSMMEDLLEDKEIISSSSVSVICEDIHALEDTMNEIQRWMNNATVSSESLEYLDQIDMLENIQKYIVILRVVLIVGIVIIAYVMNVMENKSRRKEITTLRINGLNKRMFYRMSYYENIVSTVLAVMIVMAGYIIIVLMNNNKLLLENILFVMLECVSYVAITKVLPIIFSVNEIFKKNISIVLRNG